jgi:ADP-heptose:LPS heptosyltransferase
LLLVTAIADKETAVRVPYIRVFGRTYLYGRKVKLPALALLAVRDVIILPFFKKVSHCLPTREAITEICVCKLDHLGDLLMLTPFLEAVRRSLPEAKVTLVVGSWCRELADILRRDGLIDYLVCYTPFSLNKTRANVFVRVKKACVELVPALRLLRQRRFDLFVDMRPYFPCAWLLAMLSGAKLRAGFGLRGMADTFHIIVPYSMSKRLGQLYLNALPSITGPGLIYRKPILPSMQQQVASANAFRLPSRYLAVQLSSREKARNITSALWEKIVSSLASDFSIVLLGLADDQRYPKLEGRGDVLSLIGKTSISDFLAIIEGSVGVISVDSFAAHVGLAYSRAVAVLMVDPYSQQRSYPANNSNLGLFPGRDGVEKSIAQFFSLPQQETIVKSTAAV